MKNVKPIFLLFWMLFVANSMTSQCLQADFPLEYEYDEVFLCGDYRQSNISKKASIHSKIRFYVSDFNFIPIGIDFDDGQGLRTDIPQDGTPIVIDYGTDYGDKSISLQRSQPTGNTGSTVVSEIVTIQIKRPTQDLSGEQYSYSMPDKILTFQLDEPYQPHCVGSYSDLEADHPLGRYNEARGGKAKAYIRYAPGRTELKRPLIIVEGIDFRYDKIVDPTIPASIDPSGDQIMRYGGNGWDVIVQGIDERKFPEDQPDVFAEVPIALEQFQDDDYDIIYLDFEDGSDYIEKNVELFKKCIRKVNEIKLGRRQNVVLGISMGGMVGRVGLREMELDGYEHCTRVFSTFDSPHQGASIPLSLQAMIWFNVHFYDADKELGSLGYENTIDAWHKLNRPAARQLTTHSFGEMIKDGSLRASLGRYHIGGNAERDIMDYIETWDFGCLREEFDQKVQRLGFPKQVYSVGISNGNGQGLNLLPYEPGDCILKAKVDKLQTDFFKMELRALNGEPDQQITSFLKPVELTLLEAPKVSWRMRLYTNEALPLYDNTPGGTRDDINIQIRPSLEDAHRDMEIPCAAAETGYTPVTSALDVQGENGQMADLFEDVGVTEPHENGRSPFNETYFEDLKNTPHAQVNAGNREFLLAQFEETEEDLALYATLPNAQGNWYNFGYKRKVLTPIDVRSGGRISINAAGATAFRNEAPSDKEDFDVFLRHDCHSDVLDIESGGELILGSGTAHGHLHIPKNGKVRIHKNGKLELNGNSTLVVEAGAELRLDHNCKINLKDNAQIIVKPGGVLVTSGTIRIKGTGHLNMRGELVSLSNTQIVGDGMDNLMLSGGFRVPEHSLFLRNGKARVGIFLGPESGNLTCSNIKFEGSGLIDPNSDGIVHANDLRSRVFILDCEFNGVGTAVNLLKQEGVQLALPEVHINRSKFVNVGNGVILLGMSHVNLTNSEFIGNTESRKAGWFVHTDRVLLKDNSITGFAMPSIDPLWQGAIGLVKVKTCLVSGGEYSSNNYGFHAQDGSNLVFYRGTEINDNEIGVYMEGDDIDGLVSFNCVSLINNGTAVKGKDALLEIDAYHHAATSDGQLRPNTFIKRFGRGHFDICYEARDIDQVFATGNYWGVDAPHYLDFKLINSNTSNCALHYGNIPVEVTPYESQESPFCAPIVTDGTEMTELMDDVNAFSLLVGDDVHGDFASAREYLELEDIDRSREDYSDVSAHSITVRDQNILGYPKLLVDVARSFRYDGPSLGNRSSSGFEANTLENPEVILSPNPATSTVQIDSDRKFVSLTIFAPNGEIALHRDLIDQRSIDVSALTAGLYIAQLRDENEDIEHVKLIIQ